ncbi:uncharacterized protein LOC130196771 isoform X2 [Pseudoliparis swirei]|uniref:uncharacterized protein LOC130196771 isoform X2 n=1 Tax=Pseudoliparis swirei TaxID=2059687 RepID=UPI0024BE7DB3|nr:uncharacterized protein LOC130196771 isoform X2 [Pseudoliparis swirei]
MMPGINPRVTATPKHFACALAPFPRSTWIHPLVPHDNFDRVCKNIWRRANLAEQRDRAHRAPDNTPSHRAEEQQNEARDLALRSRREDDERQHHEAVPLPCPRLSGHIRPHVAKPAQELNPVRKEEMKQNEEGKENVEDAGDGQSSVANYIERIWLPRSSSTVDKQSSAPENQPSGMNSICSAAEDHTLPPGDEEDPQLALLKNEDVKNASRSCDSHSSDDDNDYDTGPGARSCGTDDRDGDSERGNSDCDEEEKKIPYSFHELWYDREQDSPSSCTEKDFPPLSTIKSVIVPCPTELPASGKIHSQWEIPLLFCPHHSPTATFANGGATHAPAPVQGKAEAPRANSRNYAAAAASTQQEAYDLLADFPALQASKEPLALGVFHDGNPTSNDAEAVRNRRPTTSRLRELQMAWTLMAGPGLALPRRA